MPLQIKSVLVIALMSIKAKTIKQVTYFITLD